MFFRVLLLVIGLCVAFKLKCPEPAQWSFRAKLLCTNPALYYCLLSIVNTTQMYTENCSLVDYGSPGSRVDFEAPGKKIVIRGNFDSSPCSDDKYQPIIYWTNFSSDCLFLTSSCTDDGQVINRSDPLHENDNTCKCDITRDYDFVSKPNNPSFCISSQEDCSCYKNVSCFNSSLSKDYTCIKEVSTVFDTNRVDNATDLPKLIPEFIKTKIVDEGTNREIIGVAVLVVIITVMCMFVVLLFCGIKLDIWIDTCSKVYFITKLEDNIICVESQDKTLWCRVSRCKTNVQWFKDGNLLKPSSRCVINHNGEIHSLILHSVQNGDEGVYAIQADRITCRTYFKVKALICKSPEKRTVIESNGTDFVWEIDRTVDARSLSVKWYKDDIEILPSDRYMNMTSSGDFRLTIEQVELRHHGRYKIKILDKYESETFLNVKPLIIKRPENIAVIESFYVSFFWEIERTVDTISHSIKWYKDDIEILPSDKSLKMTFSAKQIIINIGHVELRHKGQYKIKILDKYESETFLDVKLIFKKHLEERTIMEGLDVTLFCEIEKTVGSMSVKWYKDDVEILPNRYIKMTSSEEVFKLTINRVELHHKGRYMITILDKYKSKTFLDVKQMPQEIKEMSQNERDAFLNAAKSGTKPRYYIRIMIVGKQRAGKTCLLRNLLMKPPIEDGQSTNCLEIELERCQISLENAEWKFSGLERNVKTWMEKLEKIVDCGFWDFAGQREFYATHQSFLTANAIYLLVVDLTDDFTEKTYIDMVEHDFDFVGDYMDFWMDNIHCYASANEVKDHQKSLAVLNPPVLIVGTGKDKIKGGENNVKEQIKKLEEHISTILARHSKRLHLRGGGIPTLSNKVPGDDFSRLRSNIFEIAKSMPKWGDYLPTRWILLEKELHSEASSGEKIISYDDVISLAASYSFQVEDNDTEVISFLRYEHEVGNIIFFESIKDYIILDHKWLVDVLRCLIAPEEFRKEHMNLVDWDDLRKTGKLSMSLIVEIFKHIPYLFEHREYVLKVMEAFDIVLRIDTKQSGPMFYLPSMIKGTTFESVLSYFDVRTEGCNRSSWICLEFTFLPPSFFNHILVAFTKKYKLCPTNEDRPALYHGIAVLNLDQSGCKKLVVCVSKNSVALQVWQWGDRQKFCEDEIRRHIVEIVNNLQTRYRMKVSYVIKLKCSDGLYYKTEGKQESIILNSIKTFYCDEHRTKHGAADAYSQWYNNLRKTISTRERETTLLNKEKYPMSESTETLYHTCDFCSRLSVSICRDCNVTMCGYCNNQHWKAESTSVHIVQHVRDMYLLDYTFKVDVKVVIVNEKKVNEISDMKLLHDGLLVIAVWYCKKLVAFYISDQQQRYSIQLPNEPRCLAVVDNNTVAVTVFSGDVMIVDVRIRKVIQTINVNVKFCSGIMYKDNQLFVGSANEITVMNMSGKVTSTIRLPVEPLYICGDETGRIYFTNYIKSYCIDTVSNGDRFTDLNIKRICAITADNEGQLLVICTDSNNVLSIGPCVNQSLVVITQIPLDKSEASICCNSISNLVCIGLDDTVYVYKKV